MSELKVNLTRRAVVGDGLRRSSLRYPDKDALIYYYSNGSMVKYTFKELNEKVNKVANNLLKRGISKGDKVAAISHNCPELVVLSYALLKIGAWYVPLNFMLGSDDIKWLINFSEAKLFFVEDELQDNVMKVADNLDSVEEFVHINTSGKQKPENWLVFDEFISDETNEPEVLINEEDVASLFFTSGTEAAPKGVLTTHKNYLASHMTYGINVGLTPDDVMILSIPIIHMAGWDLMLMAHIFSETLIMTQLPSPPQMLEVMSKHKVTATALPPTLYVALMNQPQFAKYDLPSARVFITWASTIPKAMVDGWNRVAPNLRFFTIQGSSESTATALTGSFFKTWADIPNEDGRWVGKTVAFGSELKIVDEQDKEIGVGEIGEQIIRGPVVTKGYYRNEEENKRAFREGWFHTGDMLFQDEEGNYFFADRKKDIIKTGGENVATQEVENIIGTHPSVLQCAVFGIPDPYWGEAVAAAVVPASGSCLTEEDIKGFCKERLAGFKVPKYVVFKECLPMSAANKILKRELKAEYRDVLKQK
jgi:fatty-acyl-CoA synthase